MAINTMPDIGTGSGLKTVQDLYNLINGTTEKTSGGTTTTVDSSGIDQKTMDALMKSALDSAQGLAYVSSGQRAAGGYGSSVNQMLTNDLLTRTAQKIAAENKTTIRTVTSSPTQRTVGGLSPGGIGKSAGYLYGLKALSDSGLLKKLGLQDSDSKSESDSSSPYDASQEQKNNQSDFGGGGSGGGSGGEQPMNFSSFIDSSGDSTLFPDATSSLSFDVPADAPADVPADAPVVQDVQDVPAADLPFDEQLYIPFADGGEVDSAIIRRNSLEGGGGGNRSDSGGGGARTGSSPLSSSDVTSALSALGLVGSLTGDKSLAQFGSLSSAASTGDIGRVGVSLAGILGGSNVGRAASLALNPTVGTLADVIVSLNPVTAAANMVSSILGFGSLGANINNAKNERDRKEALTKSYGYTEDTAIPTDAPVSPPSVEVSPVAPQSDLSPVDLGSVDSVDPSTPVDSVDVAVPDPVDPVSPVDSVDSGEGENLADGGVPVGVKDNIPAMVSKGEYVLPADVVDMIGAENLDALIKKYHTPSAIQKLRSFSSNASGRI